MRQVLNRLALTSALFAVACGGTIAQSAGKPAIGVDSCAAARPDFGGAATAADRALFTYDANAPLNLKKAVESTTNGVEVSAISFDSPDGGRVTGLLFDPVARSGTRPGIVLMHGAQGGARGMAGQGQGWRRTAQW
ncbi:hypothetical protein ACFSC4_22240 [Deinococcus malanensis]|uniref:hypothetical protein n=1 Tax=Deinococcus malanensis TaxID=1706855 RepID=UPI00362A0E2A